MVDELHGARGKSPVERVALTGAAGDLGRLVADRLSSAGLAVVAADQRRSASGPGVDVHVVDVAGDPASFAAAVASCEALVHLAHAEGAAQARLTGAVLAAATDAGIDHVTFVSSAMVYGAWPNNPVPISEDAPLRPNPECDFAVAKADAERMILDWVRRGDGRTATLLRPAPAMSADAVSAIGEATLAAAPVRTGDDDPPTQLVHLNDLADAVVHATRLRLPGAHNVAADGWLSGEELRALLGARLRVRLPEPLADRLDRIIARRARRPVPTGLLAYTRFPWAVANDRLRASGWSPRYGNDQTFVAADDGMPWDSMNARQRQYWSLGIGAAVLLVTAGLVARALVRRRRRAQGS